MPAKTPRAAPQTGLERVDAPAGVLEGSTLALTGPAFSEITMKPVASLVPYERNARLHTREQIEAVKRSMREFGWTIPVLVDERDGVIAGHARLIAARELGIADAPTLVARGWSEAKKRAYILADNKLTERGGWDWQMVSAELRDLRDIGADLALTGFEAFELEPLLNAEWTPAREAEPDEDKGTKPHGSTDGHSILVTIEQYEVIQRAIERVRAEQNSPRMSDGAALVVLSQQQQ